jgi:hypothetical protein
MPTEASAGAARMMKAVKIAPGARCRMIDRVSECCSRTRENSTPELDLDVMGAQIDFVAFNRFDVRGRYRQ